MHNNQDLTLARVARVLEERLRPAIHSHPHPLALAAHRVGGEPIAVASGLAADYLPAQPGDAWGRAWDTTWFRVTGTVPSEFAGRRVEVLLDLGFDVNMTGFQAEGLVYRADGSPVRSLHPRAQWIPVSRDAVGGEPIEFYVEAASNPVLLDYLPFQPTEKGDWDTAGDEPLYRLRRADVVIFESEVFELVHDVEVLLQLAQQLDATSARRAKILFALDRALDAVDLQDVAGTAAAGRAQLAEVLASPAAPSAHRITAVGHAHIDSAWLWPLRETVRKVARTTSSMATLLEEHDDFIYAMSSAQQYAWLKEHRPEVYARVKQAVADGRFVPVGGMWVESDAVLPGGESLIRQILYGQRFFRDEFGIECRGAWLPDSFGYSGALPQLLVGAGFEWFLTQKISWNERNAFPHSSFLWEGIDGSRIFTHFPSMDTYNSQLSGAEVALADRNFKEKSVGSSSLAPTGWGDGGGGTTREMVARARRLSDLEGSARVVWETPDAFFERAKAELPEPAVWRGELYLERHRATYTTQHKMKQGNRRSEQLLFEAELWASVAALRAGRPYPYEVLDRAWHEVLLLQFHDILPGTSIAWVHREAAVRYALVAHSLEEVIADSLAALGVALAEPVETADSGRSEFDRRELLVNSAPVAQHGVTAGAVGAPARRPVVSAGASGEGFVLASDAVRVVVDAAGHVVSAVDLASGREAIPAGERGNLPAAPGFPQPVGRLGRRQQLPEDAARPGRRRRGPAGRRRGRGAAFVRGVVHRTAAVPGAGRSFAGDRQHRRLARDREVPEARLPDRRLRGRRGGRDPVRLPVPRHPRQHVVGERPVRDPRAALVPGAGARLRGGVRQRLHLRLRRGSLAAGRNRRAGRPVLDAAGTAVPRPADRPRRPADAVRARLRRRSDAGHRTRLGAQRAGPPGAWGRGGPAGDVERSAGADQRGQAGRRPLG